MPAPNGPVVAEDRDRHDVPAGRLRDEVGGHLAMGEGAVGEVPEWRLAGDRLVDAADLSHRRRPARRLGVEPGEADERRVRGVDEPTVELELSMAQDARDALAIGGIAQCTYPLRRGQRWPCGSSGSPQIGHGGRPPATARAARRVKA